MVSGKHERLPKSELQALKDDLLLEAKADGVKLDIKVSENSDSTVDVTWTASPAAARSPSAPAATSRAAATAPAGDEAPKHPAPTGGAAPTARPAADAGTPSTAARVVADTVAAVAAVVTSPAAVTTAMTVGAGLAAGVAVAFVLGKLSEKFEVGNRGAGAVSGGEGDPGGVSYGCYQMTSRRNGGTVGRFVRDPSFPFAYRFAGLTPGTAEFSDAWRALAQSEPEAFRAAQHEFIRRTHFDPMIANLRQSASIDALARSAALQDCLWSTAVQHGPQSKIPLTVCEGLLADGSPKPEEGKAFDEQFIRRIYAERGRRTADGELAHFSSSSPNVQAGVAKRFERELQDALEMLRSQT